jgi:hypothetical protein
MPQYITWQELIRQAKELFNHFYYQKNPCANTFIPAIMTDEVGGMVTQGTIHSLWQDHIDWCWANDLGAGIVAPFGHGKTCQVIGRILYIMGSDPNGRIKYICNTDNNAVNRLLVVQRYIDARPKNMIRIFPQLIPAKEDKDKKGKSEKWSSHRLFIKREAKSADATLEAWGVEGGGTGGRADYLIFDDIVDFKNAIQEPARRDKVKDSFKNVWLTRGESACKKLYIATVWHEDDNTSELLKNESFCFLFSRISPDCSYIDTSLINGRDDHPIFGPKYDKRLKDTALAQKQIEAPSANVIVPAAIASPTNVATAPIPVSN